MINTIRTGWQEQCNILMIGNSFCMNYLDELHGMMAAAGIKGKICSVVAAACTLKQHWTWHQTGEKNYMFFTMDEKGCRMEEGMGLDDCLEREKWDVISCQDGEHFYRTGGPEEARKNMEPYLGELVQYIRGRFPDAVLCFHQVWAYQVGYYRPHKSMFKVPDREAQKKMHDDLREICIDVCGKYNLLRVPSGNAWERARNDVRIGDTLCVSDCEHDGEEQGGQYLNACVWFETLFGKSCIGNAFRPSYALSEEKIAAIQEIVHSAVQETEGHSI